MYNCGGKKSPKEILIIKLHKMGWGREGKKVLILIFLFIFRNGN